MSDQDLVVNRWRRYGKDRLYVSTGDTKVGFWDLTTGEAHPESSDRLDALVSAVGAWMSDHGLTNDRTAVAAAAPPSNAAVCPPGRSESPPSPRPALEPSGTGSAPVADIPAPRPWVDLATNRPGAEARGQAQAARDAAPVKTVLARALGVHTDERAWRIGADGEQKVAAQLAKVSRKDPRWRSLHAIPVGARGADIDHLLVGPGGVFTVNTKNHPGAKIWVGGNTFMVNGVRQPYVRNSRHEAARASKLLTAACGFGVHVEGLVVTVNAADLVVRSQPLGVSVTWRKNLPTWLLRHGDIHTSETLDRIFEAARRSTTWCT